MTDRELLELAAKACGFGAPKTGGTIWDGSEYPRKSGKHGALWNFVGYSDTAELWNPLTDDGDALRLAVKLRISPMYGTPCVAVGAFSMGASEEADPYAATRRAITRAAAEIGKGMNTPPEFPPNTEFIETITSPLLGTSQFTIIDPYKGNPQGKQ